MAIGFIVPNITNSKVIPDRSLSNSSKTSVRVAKFGDGYQQRVADGLNSVGSSFSVSFNNRNKTEIDDIVTFFEDKKGVASFNFTYPDTNSTSTVTATVNGAVNSSTAVALDAATTNISITAGATVTGTGISGTVTVSSISDPALVLSSVQTIANDVSLTFTNPNEREVKVICSEWSVGYTHSLFYNLSTTFERVFET